MGLLSKAFTGAGNAWRLLVPLRIREYVSGLPMVSRTMSFLNDSTSARLLLLATGIMLAMLVGFGGDDDG